MAAEFTGQPPTSAGNPAVGDTAARALDVRLEIEEAPMVAFHIKVGVMIALILFFDGYDLYNAAYIVHYVTGPWGLSPSKIGLMLSSGLAGFAAGSAVSGLFGDRFGRRKVLLFGCWASGCMSLAIAVGASGLVSFIAMRVVMGLALGLLMPQAVTFINEIAPKRLSNVFTICFFSIGWLGGASSAGLIAARLTPVYGWQSLYYVGGVALAFALVLQLLLPESVHFLASRARWPEVKALMIKIRPDRVKVYQTAQFTFANGGANAGSIGELLSSQYRSKTLSFWAAGALSLFASYGLSGWLPTILLARGENLSTSFAYGSLLSATSVVGGLIGGWFADRAGDRRRVLWVSWILGATAIAILALAANSSITLIGIVTAGAFVIGPQLVLNNLVASTYPTEIRSTGVGVFLGLARFGAMLGPAVAGVLQQWSGGPGIMFVVIGAALLLAATLLFLAAPAKHSIAASFVH